MMYYIGRPATWKAPNKKCEEVIDFANQFRNCLVADDIARDALVEELRQKVEELNHAYPRTKSLEVRRSGNFVACYPEARGADGVYVYVFTLQFLPVRRTYRFSEPATAAIQEGGAR